MTVPCMYRVQLCRVRLYAIQYEKIVDLRRLDISDPSFLSAVFGSIRQESYHNDSHKEQARPLERLTGEKHMRGPSQVADAPEDQRSSSLCAKLTA